MPPPPHGSQLRRHRLGRLDHRSRVLRRLLLRRAVSLSPAQQPGLDEPRVPAVAGAVAGTGRGAGAVLRALCPVGPDAALQRQLCGGAASLPQDDRALLLLPVACPHDNLM